MSTRQHIEQLRQLVDADLADEAAHARHSIVVGGGPTRATVLLGVDAHAAEFQHAKHPAAKTHARLAVEHGGADALFDLDGQHREGHDRQRHQQQRETCCQVESGFRVAPHDIAPEAGAEDHPARDEYVEIDLAGFALEERSELDDFDARQAAIEQVLERELLTPVVHRHHDLVDLEIGGGRDHGHIPTQQLVFWNHAVFTGRRNEPDDLETSLIVPAAQSEDASRVVSGAVDQDSTLQDVFVDESVRDQSDDS